MGAVSLLFVLTSILAVGPGSSTPDVQLTGSEFHRQGLLLAQADSPPPMPPPAPYGPPLEAPIGGRYAGWSTPQLNVELDRLERMRPSLGLPITLMAIGGGVALVGLYGFAYAVWLGLALTLPGVGLAVLGVIFLVGRLSERREIGHDIDDVKDALRLRETPQQQPQAVPPMSVQRETPSLLLAQF